MRPVDDWTDWFDPIFKIVVYTTRVTILHTKVDFIKERGVWRVKNQDFNKNTPL